jgi:hypothetical protein
MTARRIYLTPPITADIACRNCDTPITVAAKVVHDDGQPSWFVFEHAAAVPCPGPAPVEPFDGSDANGLIEPLFAAQAAREGGTSDRSPQSARVDEALERLFNAERSRKEFAEAGDHVSASAAMNAMRGVIEDLPLHDVRSLALRLFVRAVKAGT